MQPDELRTLGVDWVRANCESGSIRLAFLQQFDRAQKQACNVAFFFGNELTTRGKAYLVHFHAGEMFVFELSPTQEANHKAAANEMIGIQFLPRLEVAPAPAENIEINDLIIDGHTHIDKSQPIRGRCSYSLRSPPPVSMHFPPLGRMRIHDVEPLAVQLSYELPGVGSCTVWDFPPGQLMPQGTLEFTFPPMVDLSKQSTPWVGTTAGFVRFCTAPNLQSASGGVPLSNTCGLLLDVVA